jgi:uncharacterized protein DUF4190/zinc ribbon protein
MPYCAGCGTQLPEHAATCPSCGRPVQTSTARRTDGQAIASLALGIAGLVVCPFIPSIIAIILGNQAKQRLALDPTVEGESLARAGVILGWVGVALGGIGIAFAIIAFALSLSFGGLRF